jgi:acyl-CoA synthetase (AMP-forming)/AMP-acid ligase II
MLCEYFDLHGKWRAERTAVVFGDTHLTWGELIVRLHQLTNGFHYSGIGAGHTVAVLIDNRLETVEVMLGVIRSGAAVVPINLTISNDAIRTQFLDCQPFAIIASPAEALRIDSLGGLSAIATGHRFIVGGKAPGWVEYSTWRDAQARTVPQSLPAPDDLCTIIYSSGTTGTPKGIAHSHRGRLAFAQQGALALRMHDDGVTICSLGFFSNATWLSLLSAFIIGGTVVVVPGFMPELFLHTIEKTSATHLFLVPLQYRLLVECPELASFDVSSLQVFGVAGAVMAAGLKERVISWVDCALVEAYGLTEGFATILSDQDGRRKPTSVGRPMPGSDLKILTDDGTEAATGEPGEIVGLSSLTMDYYFNRTADTQAVFWTDTSGRQWLRTGDIGYLDEQGFLYLLDRKKDMIVSGGQNIFPIDIETVAAAHPDIAQIAVIGVAHERWGETPLAVIVPRNDAQVDTDRLLTWINERVGKRQRVSFIAFRQSLPVNALGKVLKRELREQFAEPLAIDEPV